MPGCAVTGAGTGGRGEHVPSPAAPTIWAIGSGKGGVGKSVIAANLAVVAARAGSSVVLVDADLGGANLHTLLGLRPPRRTLADFLSRRVASLADVMIPSGFERLWLISGAGALLEAASPNAGQKERVLRHITSLGVELVVLDLGAGASLNVLDFFLSASRGLLVVVPEPTSVENSYQFLRAAFFRKLRRASPRERVKQLLGEVMAARGERRLASPRELVAAVTALDAEVGEALAGEARTFAPGIVVNQARSDEHWRLSDDMARACRDYFGSAVEGLGVLEHDPLVGLSVEARRPAVERFPDAPFVRGLVSLHGRLGGGAHG